MAAKATPSGEKKEPKPGYVKIKLFRDNHRYKDDVTVGWNGKFWRIKRGVEVEVPEAVAEILENSAKQKDIVAGLEDELHAEYEAKKKEFE